ncbi:hypothetical protein GS438_18875 [Rhodococcus hoagii]|nr:hypothetical protein [Prescottella equi]
MFRPYAILGEGPQDRSLGADDDLVDAVVESNYLAVEQRGGDVLGFESVVRGIEAVDLVELGGSP